MNVPKKRAQTPTKPKRHAQTPDELADEAEHTVEDLRRTIDRGREILKKTQETSIEVEERLHQAETELKGPHCMPD